MGTKIILNTRPAVAGPKSTDAVSITAGIGNVYSGGAAGFMPQQNCNLTSIKLLLRGYDGANGQQIIIQLCNNQNVGGANRPGFMVSNSFIVPPPNDGSIAEFVFNLPATAPAALQGGSIYWITIYGGLNSVSMGSGSKMYWEGGSNPDGNPVYVGSLQMTLTDFSPSPAVPAFAVTVSD